MVEPSQPPGPPMPTAPPVPTAPQVATGRTPSISRQTLYRLSQQAPTDRRHRMTRLRGMVRSGVERSSCVLIGPNGELLAQLMGGPPAVLVDGRAVVVTGVFVTELVTTVQQGAPFRVHTAEIDDGYRPAGDPGDG